MLIGVLKERFSRLFHLLKKSKPLCSIENIDTFNKTISIRSLGLMTTINYHLKDIIDDDVVLANLSPMHSSWIGYYYGQYYSDLMNDTCDTCSELKKNKDFNFLSSNATHRFKLITQNRHGSISYLDRKENQQFCEPVLSLLSSPVVISEFDPLEACYLGILGGLQMKRRKIRKFMDNKQLKTNLKIIK